MMSVIEFVFSFLGTGLVILVVLFFLFSGGFRVVPEYCRLVVFRLGRAVGTKGPGLCFLIPLLDRAITVDLRTLILDVPVQEVITKDNVAVKVNAVIYFRVMDPKLVVIEVENHVIATSQMAQTTLRAVIGSVELDEVLSSRDKLNRELQKIIDERTDPWGIKVTAVEMKELELPDGMKRAMAKQAEAERERRAKIIAAEGELQAASKLSEAARQMETSPVTLQLRYLQTIREISGDRNTTTFFPFPIDVLKPFMGQLINPKITPTPNPNPTTKTTTTSPKPIVK